jgi:hypothetical protein
MKIEPTGAPSTTSVTRTTSDSARSSQSAGPTGSDAVHLSGDLRLADVAIRAAAVAGDVRPEAVAQAIKLFNSGDIGTDLDRLADRIIDSLTEFRDDHT